MKKRKNGQKNLLLIAGGVGINPILSMLRKFDKIGFQGAFFRNFINRKVTYLILFSIQKRLLSIFLTKSSFQLFFKILNFHQILKDIYPRTTMAGKASHYCIRGVTGTMFCIKTSRFCAWKVCHNSTLKYFCQINNHLETWPILVAFLLGVPSF